VKEVQKALGAQVDGFFGPKTEQAVKDFQTANSLDVDGIVGPRTRAKLFPEAEAKAAEPSKEHKPREGRRHAVWWLNRGAMGDAVKELQGALGVPADGFFGPRTEQAVKAFQAANSLDVDGIVGPRTRAKLFASAEKKEEAPKPVASPTPLPVATPVASAPVVTPVASAPAATPVASAPVAPAVDDQDPALVTLAGMGFHDVNANARLVKKYNGDLEQVVAELLGA